MQGIAEPNMVVIAEDTRRLLGNLFELGDLGAKNLKGITGPLHAWAALRASSVESRFEALHTTGLTALVGREEELELLLRRWSRAKTGEGQVVLLSGEAGIGKSRLTAALLENLASEPHTRLRYFCSPQHTDSAFYPIIGRMERAAGLRYDDKPQAKLDKLDTLLAQTSTSIQDAALFAEMLSLPNDGRYPALELISEQRRQRTLDALAAQLPGLARQQPVLMIVEDAHWIDPTSLEVFGRTVDQIKTLPGLLIVTFRPEFNPPWAGRSHVMSLALNRLGERETAAIIARLVGNKELPADVMAEIVERTDGIPLWEESAPKRGFFRRLRQRLKGTRQKFVHRIDRLVLGKKVIDEDLLDELEEILITSDLGVKTTAMLLRKVADKVKRKELSDPARLMEHIREEIRGVLSVEAPVLDYRAHKPLVVMIVGVNGTGKTTTTGKLANQLKLQGLKPMLVAGDTFRAAAVEQLSIWGERVGVPVIKQKSGSDPSAVVFDALDAAVSRDIDVVLMDTAGRMHTKVNLMEELKKIHRVINKKMPDAPHEVFLVLDASTGQNALSQAKLFKEQIGLTGLILTKLDGTAKGGIIAAICEELQIPVRYIGIGESIDDLRPFDPEEFTNALF